MARSKTLPFIAVILLFLFTQTASADIIYLTNGSSLKGLITEENDEHVVLDIGFGTFTIRQEEIERIERSAAGEDDEIKDEWRRREIETGAWAPPGGEEILQRLTGVKSAKKSFLAKKIAIKEVTKEIDDLRAAIEDLSGQIDSKSRIVADIDPERETLKYNKYIGEMNNLSAKLTKRSNRLQKSYKRYEELQKGLPASMSEFRREFYGLKKHFKEKLESLGEEAMDQDEEYFFEHLSNEIDETEKSFRKIAIAYTKKGSQVVVDAVLHDSVTASLLVDTGATLTVISYDIARQMGIDPDSLSGEIIATLADGKTIKAKPFILESISVGDVRIEGVRAAIQENPPGADIDGLLGMSFLNNFDVRIDSGKNELILETLD